MARRASADSSTQTPAQTPAIKRGKSVASVNPTPAPPGTLHVSILTWSAGASLHRVHHQSYGATTFNPGAHGNARFSPIVNARGKPIPTLYAGATFACAAMETVFHDVSYAPGYKAYDKNKLLGQIHSELRLKQDLTLADLRSKALRKLGIKRDQLIDTEKDRYPDTRQWAQAIHQHDPTIQGLCWTSRQDDSASAVILFGDRIGSTALQQTGVSRSLVDDERTYSDLLDLAEQIGLNIVVDR